MNILPISETVDAIDRKEYRNDTEGVGIILLWNVLGLIFNLASICYLYLTTYQPLTILLVYLLLHFTFVYFIHNLKYTQVQVDRDAIPRVNDQI